MNKSSSLKNFMKDIKQIFALISLYKSNLVISTICALIITVIGLICPKLISYATNQLFYGSNWDNVVINSINFENVFSILLIALCLYIIIAGLSIIKAFLSSYLSSKLNYNIRKDIINKIHKLKASNLENIKKGDILSRILNDVNDISDNISSTFVDFVVNLSSIIGSLIMMLTINHLLTLIVVLYCPISIILITLLIKFTQRYFINQKNLLGEVNSYMEESINGHALIQSFNKQKEFEEKFININNKLFSQDFKSAIFGSISNPINDILNNLIYIIILFVGGVLSIQGQITLGDIIAFNQYSNAFKSPLNAFVSSTNTVQRMAASIRRIFNFLNLEEEDIGSITLTDNKHTGEPIIKFENVNFSYKEKHPIIKDFTLEIFEGETVAIVGPTGAGKTTIGNLLMKFYQPNSGNIYLYGNNINKINTNSLRNKISMVSQDIWLYNATIEENIKYGKHNASKNEVRHYAEVVNADKFIDKLDGKWNYVINESAKNLSQGQKQLLSIARSLLPNKPILILDEATSSVDSATETDIYKTFDKVIKQTTSIVIAHRLSTIKNADKIIVINNGEIIECGSHNKLIADKGFYYDLYKSSTR